MATGTPARPPSVPQVISNRVRASVAGVRISNDAWTIPVVADPLPIVEKDTVWSDDALPGERLRTVMVRQYTLS